MTCGAGDLWKPWNSVDSGRDAGAPVSGSQWEIKT